MGILPSVEEMKAAGVSPLILDELRDSSLLRPLSNTFQETGDEVGNIFQNFDTRGFTFLTFYFLEETRPFENFTLFGQVEAPYIGYENGTKEIFRLGYEYVDGDPSDYDYLPPSERLGYADPVALGISEFLDGLFLAATLSSWRWTTRHTTDERAAQDLKYAALCTEAAGGERYKPFWWGFCGTYG